MGIFSKIKSDVPDDTVGRILTRNPNVVRIEQVKERNVKYMPWLSSKKTTVFHFQPDPSVPVPPSSIASSSAPPSYKALPEPPTETSLVQGHEGTVTQVTTLAIDQSKGGTGGQAMEWGTVTQWTTTILGAAAVAAAGGKKAYDLYRTMNGGDKKE